MPRAEVRVYIEADGSSPFLEWIDDQHPNVRVKLLQRLERLAELGYEIRRPEADVLRGGVHELRVGYRGRNYRVLYFFHGQLVAILSHGLTKERTVPSKEIDIAIARKKAVEANPSRHAAAYISLREAGDQ